MTPARRWPLHPPPTQGEALSSWLIRLADVYHMSLADLLRHNLGPASFDVGDHNTGALDWNPPTGVVAALHERTGVPLDQLHHMSLAGWVPWLLDTLAPADDPAAFTTYVQQDSVLLRPGEAVPRDLPGWRPWLPGEPMRRACPTCIAAERGFTLMSQIPLMTTCPAHACRLRPSIGSLGVFLAFHEDTTSTEPAAVHEHVVAMDRRTHEGITTGTVTLPRRAVHVGVWFRLLRILLDELNTPTSQLRPSAAKATQRIWRATGRPPRGGQTRWRPYEALDWSRQQAMLEAAAAALHLVEAGHIAASGSLAHLLRPEPRHRVPDGDPPVDRSDPWRQALDELNAAVEAAQEDPEAARQLLRLFTSFCRTQASFDRTRQALIDAGVPEQFLPQYQAEVGAIVRRSVSPGPPGDPNCVSVRTSTPTTSATSRTTAAR